MSTKTTFKRVALVAVAALSMGVLTSVAPASAAANTNLQANVSYALPGTEVPTALVSNGVSVTYTVPATTAYVVGQVVSIDVTQAAYDYRLLATYATISAVTATSITVTPAVAPAVIASTATTGTIDLASTNKTYKGLAGAANTVTVGSQLATTKEYLVVTGGTFSDGTSTKTVTGTGGLTPTAVIVTPTAGSITVAGYAETTAGSGVFNSTATDSLTITVVPAIAGTVYSTSATTVTVGGNGTSRIVIDADLAKSYYSAAAVSLSTASFNATVIQSDANSIQIADVLAKSVSATITGVGTLSMNSATAQGGYVTTASTPGSFGSNVISVFADGRAGTGTVTVSVGGVVAKTFTVTFYGTVASYAVTTNHNYVGVGANAGTFTVKALDANGVAVPGVSILATSSSDATATIDAVATTAAFTCVVDTSHCSTTELAAMGKASFATAGVAKGAITATFKNAATAATITATGTTKVTGSQAATATWAFDAADYVIGSAVKVTITLKDSDGNPVADNATFALFSDGPASSMHSSTVAAALAAAIDVTDGAATLSFFAPVTSGTMKITGTLATGASVAAALRGVETSISATVSNADVQAATDAAAEATDAANAATDAANAAAEAADAATAAAQDASDAVAALSAQVATLISALRAQLTSLTNLVIKIQKKVKA